MSTRCRIGIRLNHSTKIVSIYCHSDGYPSGVGSILRDYYNTEDKIIKLLNLGDLSMLGTEPIDSPDLWDFNSGMTELARDRNYEIPLCRTYRGRGEANVGARVVENLLEYLKTQGEEYNYLFCDGQWYVVSLRADGVADHKTINEAIEEE